MRALIRLYRYVRPYRGQAIAALVLLLGMVAADLAIPRLSQRIIDQGVAQRDLHVVWTTSLIMLGVALVSALFAIVNNALSVRVGQGFAADVRSALVRRVQSFSFANLDRVQTGQLIVRSTSDVNFVQMIVQMSLRILTRAPIWMLGAIAFLFLTSVDFGLIVLAFFPVVMLFVLLFAGPARKLFLGVQKRLDRLNTVLQENLAGVRVVKAFVREHHESARFGSANEALTEQSIRVYRLLALLMPLMMAIMNAAVIVALWFGGTMTLDGAMTVGQVVASVNYLGLALFPLMMLAAMVAPLAAADASASRILEILDGEPDVKERPAARPLEAPRGRIAFEDVGFSYSADGRDPVLRERQLRRRAGGDGGHPRRDGVGEVDAHPSDSAVLRRDARTRDVRRSRRARSHARIAAIADRGCPPGGRAVQRHDPRQHPLWTPRRIGRRDRGRGAGRAGGGVHPSPA